MPESLDELDEMSLRVMTTNDLLLAYLQAEEGERRGGKWPDARLLTGALLLQEWCIGNMRLMFERAWDDVRELCKDG